MDSVPFITVLLFIALFIAALWAILWMLQRGGQRIAVRRSSPAPERRRIAHLLHDDIGQKIAAARVNLSALRLQLRTGGLPESAELDAAMNLLDDGCRDLRTVSRLMDDGETKQVNADGPTSGG